MLITCRNGWDMGIFILYSSGRKNFESAISSVKSFGAHGNALWFGFGVDPPSETTWKERTRDCVFGSSRGSVGIIPWRYLVWDPFRNGRTEKDARRLGPINDGVAHLNYCEPLKECLLLLSSHTGWTTHDSRGMPTSPTQNRPSRHGPISRQPFCDCKASLGDQSSLTWGPCLSQSNRAIGRSLACSFCRLDLGPSCN